MRAAVCHDEPATVGSSADHEVVDADVSQYTARPFVKKIDIEKAVRQAVRFVCENCDVRHEPVTRAGKTRIFCIGFHASDDAKGTLDRGKGKISRECETNHDIYRKFPVVLARHFDRFVPGASYRRNIA